MMQKGSAPRATADGCPHYLFVLTRLCPPENRAISMELLTPCTGKFLPCKTPLLTFAKPTQNQHKTNTFPITPGGWLPVPKGPTEAATPEGLIEAVPVREGHKTISKPDKNHIRPPGGVRPLLLLLLLLIPTHGSDLARVQRGHVPSARTCAKPMSQNGGVLCQGKGGGHQECLLIYS
jgi:hypothetical protein